MDIDGAGLDLHAFPVTPYLDEKLIARHRSNVVALQIFQIDLTGRA